MNTPKPKTRIEAAKPESTKHLSDADKRKLDIEAEAQHADGKQREKLTRKMSEQR
jgi:hypothetical protein